MQYLCNIIYIITSNCECQYFNEYNYEHLRMRQIVSLHRILTLMAKVCLILSLHGFKVPCTLSTKGLMCFIECILRKVVTL